MLSGKIQFWDESQAMGMISVAQRAAAVSIHRRFGPDEPLT